MTSHHCHCPCGETTFTVKGAPLLRSICHCTICQEFNEAPFADICIVKNSAVSLDNPDNIEYKTYGKPAIVPRGKCKTCGKPAIEFIETPLGKLVAIIPSGNFPDQDALPPISCHGFYNRRQADADDSLPKFNGYLASQAGWGKHLSMAMLKKVFE